MLRVKIAELRDGLSRFLRAVEAGDEIEVLDRHRPIARIVPVPAGEDELQVMEARGSFAEIRGKRYPPSNLPYDVVELLIEDRRKR